MYPTVKHSECISDTFRLFSSIHFSIILHLFLEYEIIYIFDVRLPTSYGISTDNQMIKIPKICHIALWMEFEHISNDRLLLAPTYIQWANLFLEQYQVTFFYA